MYIINVIYSVFNAQEAQLSQERPLDVLWQASYDVLMPKTATKLPRLIYILTTSNIYT